MEWLWIILGIIFLLTFLIIFLVMASKKLHPTKELDDNDQMEAIRKYNEKRAQRSAKKKPE